MTTAGSRWKLQGAENFRELGGYPAANGLTVRRGLLFRSDAPDRLTAADHAEISRLGIRLVCDFRAGAEVRGQASQWNEPRPEFCRLPIDPGVNEALVFEAIRRNPEPETARQAMLSLYRSMPVDNAAHYRTLIGRILAGCLPLLFHCTAGKDRTGLFAALMLTALGTPYEIVMRDYLLSDEYLRTSETVRRLLGMMRQFLQLDESAVEVAMPFLSVDRSYLETAFESIRETHGTVQRYLEASLGLDGPAIEALRRMLVE